MLFLVYYNLFQTGKWTPVRSCRRTLYYIRGGWWVVACWRVLDVASTIKSEALSEWGNELSPLLPPKFHLLMISSFWTNYHVLNKGAMIILDMNIVGRTHAGAISSIPARLSLAIGYWLPARSRPIVFSQQLQLRYRCSLDTLTPILVS